MSKIPKAVLKNEIPESRYKMLEGNKHPEIGDILELDQAYTNEAGKAMVLAYHPIENNIEGKDNYSANVYESEIEIIK